MKGYITDYVKQFYLLNFMKAMMEQSKMAFLRSTEKWLEDLDDVYSQFTSGLANMLYDYIIYASAMELSNAPYSCEYSPVSIAGQHIWDFGNYITKHSISQLDPYAYMRTAYHVFNDFRWKGYYGGPLWAQAVRYAMNRHKMNDILFIDSVIDLQHNTGSLFSKSNPFFMSSDDVLLKFLSAKTNIIEDYDLFEYLYYKAATTWDEETYYLTLRFIHLYAGRHWSQNTPGLLTSPYRRTLHRMSCLFPDYANNLVMGDVRFYQPVKYEYKYYTYEFIESAILQKEKYGKVLFSLDRRRRDRVADEYDRYGRLIPLF